MAKGDNIPDETNEADAARRARHNELARKYYARDKEAYLERSAKWKREHQEQLLEYRKNVYAQEKESIKEKVKKYYAENKDKIRIREKAHRDENRDALLALRRAKYAENAEKVRALSRQWAINNPEKVRKSLSAWRNKNTEHTREYSRQYLVEHPEIAKFNNQRRRARKLNAAGNDYITQELLEGRWSYYGRKCYLCGADATATDHVIPLSRGGSQYPANLRPVCRRCNAIKGAKWPYDFTAHKRAAREEIQTWCDVLGIVYE